MPLGPALLEPAGGQAGGLEAVNGLVSHHAERAATVGDDLAIAGELVEVPLQLGEWDGPGTLDVTGLELVGGADVDDDNVASLRVVEAVGAVETSRLDDVADQAFESIVALVASRDEST